MKRAINLFLIILMMTGLSTCDDAKDEDPCGESKKPAWYWGKGFTMFLDEPSFHNYINGNDRIFEVISPVIENVCPGQHIKVLFMSSINIPDTLVRDLTLMAEYVYGPFGIYAGEIEANEKNDFQGTYDLKGQGEFGIKNAYDQEPGAFILSLKWVMKNYQDEQVDVNYFLDNIKYAALACEYKEYKAP